MKTFIQLCTFIFFITSLTGSFARAADPWKGHTDVPPIEVGLMGGGAIFGSSTNFGVLASGAYLIKKDGWINDIDNRVWVELEMGPTFFDVAGRDHTGMEYSAHLRWDFTYDEYWTLYALGGLGGFVLPDAVSSSSFAIHPRVGLGAEYQTKVALLFRGEVSADFIGIGVGTNF